MTKSEIITSLKDIDTDDDMSIIVSMSFGKSDAEIVAVLAAWLSNGLQGESYALLSIVEEIMQGKPSEYIENYVPYMNFGDVANNQCFFRMFSYGNLDALMKSIKREKERFGDLQEAFEEYMSRPIYGCNFVHDSFAKMFGHGTMFPSNKSNGTFYRYNLLYYWLTYKLKIWHINPYDDVALLPCNDKIFSNAYIRGFTKKKLKSTCANAAVLTDIAHSIFVDNFSQFFKLYEYLAFCDD